MSVFWSLNIVNIHAYKHIFTIKIMITCWYHWYYTKYENLKNRKLFNGFQNKYTYLLGLNQISDEKGFKKVSYPDGITCM